MQGLLAATVSASHFATIVEGTYCSVVERLMNIMSVSGILENGFLDRIETHFSFFLVVIKIDVLLEQTGCLRAR